MRKTLRKLTDKYSFINTIVRTLLKIYDPLVIAEIDRERYIFNRLKELKFLDDLEKKRILEIGPMHGKDSLLLAGLKPKELVLIDLPEKDKRLKEWLPAVSNTCPTTYIQGNILYLLPEDFDKLGKFDLVWCTGVIYHNPEQLRLLKKLFDLCRIKGRVVVESEVAHNRKIRRMNAVEIHWPEPFGDITVTHLPSPLAIKSWMEMVGFAEVKIRNILSKLHRNRAVVTGVRLENSKSYSYYVDSSNPLYTFGDAT